MSKQTVQLKIVRPQMQERLPRYATQGSAGLDLHACIERELILQPGQTELIPTGIAIHLADANLAAMAAFEVVSDFAASERGEGGFGSTGRG